MNRQILAVGLLTSALLGSYARAEPPPMEPKDLTQLVDGLVEKEMTRSQIPGAVVVVVKDGQLVLAKGYGFANLEEKVPVDAEKTRFFVASVTKTVTATAVMQLVEKGQLDLDADVNRYLKAFQVPATFARPITLTDLMTHTSGLDTSLLGMGVPEGGEPLALEQHLKAHLPGRVRPPGELFSYSNRNYSLAGYLVELASGVSFPRYVEQNILTPLGMQHSGFSLPADRAHELAVGYQFDEGAPPRPWPTPLMNDLPAGGLMATGTDMAKFMIAHLQDGAPLLAPATEQRMRKQQWTFSPGLDGMTLGFMEDSGHGRRALEHEGFMAGFFSLLYLVPELGLGIFVETNGGSEEANLVYGLHDAILDRYFPLEPKPAAPALAASDLRARRLEGDYRSVDHSNFTLEKVGVVGGMSREAEVRVGEDGGLQVNGHPYLEVEKGVFKRADKDTRIAFREGAMANGLTAYERVPWHASLLLNRLVLVASLLIFLVTIVAWPLTALVRRIRKKQPRPGLGRGERWAARLVALLPIVFLGGIAASCLGPMGPLALFVEIPLWVKALFLLPFLMIPLVLATAFSATRAWRLKVGSLFARLSQSAIALAGAGFLVFLGYWNLLGFKF